MKTREIEQGELKMVLGKDETGNNILLKKYKGKENIILRTPKSGSPFGVIEKLNPSGDELYLAGIIVAKFSLDWKDPKRDIKVYVFTGKDISKSKDSKSNSWKVKKKKAMVVTKESILKFKKLAKTK